MKRRYLFLFTVLFSCVYAFMVYAAATPSEADPDLFGPSGLPAQEGDNQDFDDWSEEEVSEEEEYAAANPDATVELVQLLKELVGGGQIASSSEATLLEDSADSAVLGQVTPYYPAGFLSVADQENFVNCLRYDVSVDGVDYTLLFSPSYNEQIYIDSQNRLWNMGTSQIQGLVLDGDFNPYQTSGTLVYLAPCLGNNFSKNMDYGSPNWFRRYYWSSGRLTYDDTYVQISVTKAYHTFSSGDLLMYILIFLVGGGVLICWLNRFRHY